MAGERLEEAVKSPKAVLEEPDLEERLKKIVNGFSGLPSFLEDSDKYVFYLSSIPDTIKYVILRRFANLYPNRERDQIEVARVVSEELTKAAVKQTYDSDSQSYDLGLLTQAFAYARKQVLLMEAEKPLNYENLKQVRNKYVKHRRQAYKNMAKIANLLLSQPGLKKGKLAEYLLGYDKIILALSERVAKPLDIAITKMYIGEDLVRLAGLYLTRIEQPENRRSRENAALLKTAEGYQKTALEHYRAAKAELQKVKDTDTEDQAQSARHQERDQVIHKMFEKVQTGINDATELDQKIKSYMAQTAESRRQLVGAAGK